MATLTKVFNPGELGHTISDLARIDFDVMLKNKLKRARESMKRYNISAMLCLTPQNVAYATNIQPMGGTAVGIGGNVYAILPAEGTPICFYDSDGAYHLKNLVPNVRIEYSIPPFGGPWHSSSPEAQQYLTKMFADQIYDILKELKLDKEVIGVDSYAPHIAKELEKRGLKLEFGGAKAMLEARTIKTPEEQQLVRLLASILDNCFALMARTLRPGVSEREVWAKVTGYAIEQGLTPDGGYIASGPHTWPKDTTRTCSDRRIRPGDVVWADLFNFGCFGYRSCYYRAFSVGPPSSDVKETYRRVIDWLKESERVLRPGVTTKDVVEKWPDEVKLWSSKPPIITDERTALSTFFNNMGHGIGLHNYDPPFFWRPLSIKWPQKLEAGMTIALETEDGTSDNCYGIRVEDMLIITEGGYENISRWPEDEITEVPLY